MFTTLIVQPIFNLLVLIYAILPGHNFGLALIIFTIVIRMLLWPLVRKQLRQTKAMRALQPELKRIKQATKGDRQKEMSMQMELYKERGINPYGTIPVTILQVVVLIGLYSGLRRVIANPHNLITFAYPALRHLSWMQELAHNIHLFDNTLFGVVNLSRSALVPGGGIYYPAMLIVIGSAVAQFFQAKQLMPTTKDSRGLREILKSAGDGKQADQSEVNAAVGRSTRFLLPVMIFVFTVNLASALSLYWLTGGIVAFIQQSLVLRKDETEMEAIADKPVKNVAAIPEAEVVSVEPKVAKKTPKNKKSSAKKKRKR
jgi:YidC/Oxa1 family membrane protein insertase